LHVQQLRHLPARVAQNSPSRQFPHDRHIEAPELLDVQSLSDGGIDQPRVGRDKTRRDTLLREAAGQPQRVSAASANLELPRQEQHL
jgi:hypothetical protein